MDPTWGPDMRTQIVGPTRGSSSVIGVHPTCSPDSWTRLVEPKKQGVVPDWTLVFSPRGALKIRRCSVLDSWIVHALEVFDLWIVEKALFWPKGQTNLKAKALRKS